MRSQVLLVATEGAWVLLVATAGRGCFTQLLGIILRSPFPPQTFPEHTLLRSYGFKKPSVALNWHSSFKMTMQAPSEAKLSKRHSHLGAHEASLWAPLKAEMDHSPRHAKDLLFFPSSSLQPLRGKEWEIKAPVRDIGWSQCGLQVS